MDIMVDLSLPEYRIIAFFDMKDDVVRYYLAEMLNWENAHIGYENLFSQIPSGKINFRIEGSPHSFWDLLEHMRISQWDILDFIKNPDYQGREWPKEYWPDKNEADKNDWDKSKKLFFNDLNELQKIARNSEIDLTAPIPHAPDYTIFRELILVADHNTYHFGQMVFLKKAAKISLRPL